MTVPLFLRRLCTCGSISSICHLGNLDSRGRSRETRLTGLELTDWAEISLVKAVDACNSEPVCLTWSQLLLLPALVVLRPWQLPLGEGLMGKERMDRG